MAQFEYRTILLRADRGMYEIVTVDLSSMTVVTRNACDLHGLNTCIVSSPAHNFSIVNGEVKEDCGALSRLSHNAATMVVLKASVGANGDTKGFYVLNTKNFQISLVSKNALIEQQKRQGDNPLLQNAIIRNGTVNAYPGKKFESVVDKKQSNASSASDSKSTDQDVVKRILSGNDNSSAYSPQDFMKYAKECCSVVENKLSRNSASKGSNTGMIPYVANMMSWMIAYEGRGEGFASKAVYMSLKQKAIRELIDSPETRDEFRRQCPEFDDFVKRNLAGISSGGTKKPRGASTASKNAEVRNMLNDAKRKGVCTKYFENSSAPEDVMELYCDVMYDEELAKNCKPIFDNPDLSLGQVRVLVDGASLGMDVSDMCDGNTTESEIRLKVAEKMDAIYESGGTTTSVFSDVALLEKCKSMKKRKFSD